MNPPDTEAVHTDLPISVTLSTIEEIRRVISQIKCGEAAGPDHMPVEALKLNIEVTASVINVLFRKIKEEEQVSTD
ncbi:unnamed protein product [Schistosoma curassoni]|uniref:Prophage protein n=1 Tax=Schistosoma curassoni TaxID=6186 RepID=A0A183KR62_9TREM|nr:unnamed protein product [Schistosoma curassoni]